MATEKKIYPKFRAVASGGKLYLDEESQFSQYLLTLGNKPLSVVVKPATKERSRQEEKYYHAVVVRMVAEAMDLQDQEAHEFLKSLFLRTEEQTKSGLRYERIKSTTELNDLDYRVYWQKCVYWASLPTNPSGLSVGSGLELYIPEPNAVDYESY